MTQRQYLNRSFPKPVTQVSQTRKIAHQEQRERMLAAAAQLFGNRGFHVTTLDEVAARVGLTKPRLFFHFKEGKPQILRECLARALFQSRAVVAEVKSSQSPLDETAVGPFIERYADVAFGDFGMCLARSGFEYLDAKERDILLRQKADIDVDFKALIAEALRGRSRSDADPEFLWLMVTLLVQGIALLERPVAEKRTLLSKAAQVLFASLSTYKFP